MRVALSVALLLAAAPLAAQDVVGGVAIDSATGVPMRCVDVTLQDTTGHVLARTQTTSDGTFHLEGPAGPHELEFTVWNRAPVRRATLSMDSATRRSRLYTIAFEPAPPVPVIMWPDTVDSPPGRPIKIPRMRGLIGRGEPAVAVVRYAVDSTGRVDRSSIQMLESSSTRWERTVVDFLREVQYEPARRNGQPVCALVYALPFNFNAHP